MSAKCSHAAQHDPSLESWLNLLRTPAYLCLQMLPAVQRSRSPWEVPMRAPLARIQTMHLLRLGDCLARCGRLALEVSEVRCRVTQEVTQAGGHACNSGSAGFEFICLQASAQSGYPGPQHVLCLWLGSFRPARRIQEPDRTYS